jgi:cytochrome c peroxidase
MAAVTARNLAAAAFVVLCLAGSIWYFVPREPPPWSAPERALLQTLSLASLPTLPEDPTNAVADDPAAVAFGERLFFDPRLSGNGAVSCATCHQPALGFTDGKPKGEAIGTSRRHTPSIAGSAYSPWLYWDGRKGSLWAQALAPLEDPDEHGSDRAAVARLIAQDAAHRADFERLFGPLPDVTEPEAAARVFVGVGKALAAFERRIGFPTTRFDRYVAAVLANDMALARETFGGDETWGLRIFVGKGQCTQCHNGPLLTNHEFHNTGVISAPGELPDRGRIDGWRALEADPFNCLGPYSDDSTRACTEHRFARAGADLLGAMRTPSLRNVAQTAPYMHGGQLATLREVIRHYDAAPPAMIGHNEIKPLGLNRRERAQLEAFLHTLTATPTLPDHGPNRPTVIETTHTAGIDG